MNLAIDPPDLDDDDQSLVEAGPVRLARTDIFRGGLVIATAVLIGVFVISSGLDRSGTDTGATGTGDSLDPAAASADAEPAADAGSVEDTAEAESAADDPSLAGQGADNAASDGAAGTPAPSTDIAGAEVDGADDPAATTETTAPPPVARPPAEVRVLVLNGSEIQGIAARATGMVAEALYQTAVAQNADELGPSAIFFAEGFDLEAIAVAEVFSPTLSGIIQPLTVENQPVADLQGANVIVVVGGDGVIPVG